MAVPVWLHGELADVEPVARLAAEVQHAYQFETISAPNAVPVLFERRAAGAPVRLEPGEGLHVSTWQSEGICAYTGLSRDAYLLLFTIIGLTQWQALRRNPALLPEDLINTEYGNCLFARPLFIEEYALLLEYPRICGYCHAFYASLCTEPEIEALEAAVAVARRQSTHMRGTAA